MSETAEKAREAMKAKAKRLAGEPHQKVDSSDWTPPEMLNAGVKTGMRPLSPRQFKKGGKVVGKAAGKKSAPRADRAPRKDGGRSDRYLTPDNLINRDQKMANETRKGIKHVGGYAKGGHPDAAEDRAMIKKMVKGSALRRADGGKASDDYDDDPYGENEGAGSVTKDGKKSGGKAMHHKDCTCKMCSGGRAARKSGGRTKGKTNINIIIGHGERQQPPMGAGAMPNAPVRPPVMPMVPPPAAMGAGPMGAGAPPSMPMGGMPPGGLPMPRKSGGRAKTIHVINHAAGGGKGRLEKIEAYGHKASR